MVLHFRFRNFSSLLAVLFGTNYELVDRKHKIITTYGK
jgi:hypothetical protein